MPAAVAVPPAFPEKRPSQRRQVTAPGPAIFQAGEGADGTLWADERALQRPDNPEEGGEGPAVADQSPPKAKTDGLEVCKQTISFLPRTQQNLNLRENSERRGRIGIGIHH